MGHSDGSRRQDADITVAERRDTLEAVLGSRTFARSDRLRKLLRFLSEAEMEGRGNELNEYRIGVEALDRPEGYSTSEDSSVRSRIYELRQKLDRFYSEEAPHAELRIELNKGTHSVRFVRGRPRAGARLVGDRRVFKMVGAGVLAGVLIAFAVLSLGLRWRPLPAQPGWTPEMEAIWRPFLDRGTPIMISFETRLFVQLAEGVYARDGEVNEMGQVESSQALMKMQRLFATPKLYENRYYNDFGSTQAVFLIARQLSARKPEIHLALSVDLTWNDIHGNHLILLGKADTDPQIRHFLAGTEFRQEGQRIRVVHPRQGEPSEYTVSTEPLGSPNWVEKYAVITVVPGPDPSKRVLILTATGSEIPWAAASYLTTPASAKNLVDHLRLPSGRLPDFYQVLVRAEFRGRQPTRTAYVTHRVLSPGAAGK
jgi:hypothetical protein